MELTFYTALLIGLLGSTHCIGMCGGIVGVLNTGLPQKQHRMAYALAHHLTYNTGRIASYVAAGALAGLIGSQLSIMSIGTIVPVGRVIAGLFMIALGLYLAGWWHAISRFEKIGLVVWKRIEPLGRRFIPAKNLWRAFGLGLVWGWLPCGLVYSTLALSMISATPAQGAWIMLGFGIGTMPALFAMGGVANQLTKVLQKPLTRKIAGLSIIIFGVYTCFLAFGGHGDHHMPTNHTTARYGPPFA